MSDTSRRAVLAGAAGVSAAVALAGCASDDGDPAPAAGRDGGSDTAGGATGGAGGPTGGSDSRPSSAGGSGESLGSRAAVPVGGGKVYEAQKVVVTQPVAGQYKAFSAACPHRGCSVAAVADGKINCPCHNSNFSATDGSRLGGPATTGLAPRTITVDGDTLRLT